MVKITATYKSKKPGFKTGQAYILFPARNSDFKIYIHTARRRSRVYRSASDFLEQWAGIEAYQYKASEEDKKDTAEFLTNYLKIIK